MEPEVVKAEMILPNVLPFKRVQRTSEKHTKGHPKTKHWKHLKQIIQSENFQDYSSDQSNYVNIETPPSMYPPKKYCDITGFQESSGVKTGWGAVMVSEIIALIAAGTVHRVCITTCFIFSSVLLYEVSKLSGMSIAKTESKRR